MSADLTPSSRTDLNVTIEGSDEQPQVVSGFLWFRFAVLCNAISLASDGFKRPPVEEIAAPLPFTEALTLNNTPEFRGYGFGPEQLARIYDEDLASYLAAEHNPSWLGKHSGPIFWLFDSNGAASGIRHLKYAASRTEAGYETIKGQVLANLTARGMLAGALRPSLVVFVEGESDFFTTCLNVTDPATAVVGLVKGAITQAITDRIPANTSVVLRFDPDEAGDAYALKVGRMLTGRCPLLKQTKDPQGRDQNALWQAGELATDPRAGCTPYTPAPEVQPTTQSAPTTTAPSLEGGELSDERKMKLCALLDRDLHQILISHGRHEAALHIGTQIGRREAAGIVDKAFIDAWLQILLAKCSGDRDASRRKKKSKTTYAKRQDTIRAFEDGREHGQKSPYWPKTYTGRRSLVRRKDRAEFLTSEIKRSEAVDAQEAKATSDARELICSVISKPVERDQWPDFLRKAENNGAHVRVLYKQYLEEGDLKTDLGELARAIFVHSTQGSAKTEVIAALSRKMKALGKAVLYVTHRQNLNGQASVRLELVDYRACDDVAHAPRLSICLNSFSQVSIVDDTVSYTDENGRRQTRKFGLIVIDESQQVIDALYGPLVGENSKRLYDHLRAAFRCAEHVVFADADLGRRTHVLARNGLGLPEGGSSAEMHVHNLWFNPNRRYELFEERTDLLSEMLERILCDDFTEYGPMLVACSFKSDVDILYCMLTGETLTSDGDAERKDAEKKDAEDDGVALLQPRSDDLVTKLREKHPKLRILHLTSETAKDGPGREFLLNPRLHGPKYDIITYSPTLGTGFDLSFPADSIWGFFGAGTHTSHDVMQMLARGRDPKDDCVRMWVDGKRNHASTNPDDHKRDVIERITAGAPWARYALNQFTQVVEDGFVSFEANDRDHFDLWALVQAENAALSNNLRGSIIDWIEAHGAKWTWIEHDTCDPTQRKRKNRLSKHRKTARELTAQQRNDLIDQAAEISSSTLAKYRAVGTNSSAEEYEFIKAKLREHLGRKPNPEDIQIDQAEHLSHKTSQLAWLRAFWSGATDCFEDNTHRLLSTRSHVALSRSKQARAKIYDEILREAGFDFNDPLNFEYSHQGLLEHGFIELVHNNRRRLGAFVNIPEDLEANSTTFITRLLDALGIKTKMSRRRVQGEQRRHYSIDETSLQRAMAWSEPMLNRLLKVCAPLIDPQLLATPASEPIESDWIQAFVQDHLEHQPTPNLDEQQSALQLTQERIAQHNHPVVLSWWATAPILERWALSEITQNGLHLQTALETPF